MFEESKLRGGVERREPDWALFLFCFSTVVSLFVVLIYFRFFLIYSLYILNFYCCKYEEVVCTTFWVVYVRNWFRVWGFPDRCDGLTEGRSW